MSQWVDLGHGHAYSPTGWHPDRELNPQYADQPDVDFCGVIVRHTRSDDGTECKSAASVVRLPGDRKERDLWQLVSREPLHLEPSLLCQRCGDHGFIRDGKWVTA